MLLNKYRWTLPFAVSLLVAIACGQFSVGKITPTADNAVGETLAVISSISTSVSRTLTPDSSPTAEVALTASEDSFIEFTTQDMK